MTVRPQRKYGACVTCETAWIDSPTCWMCGRPADHRETVPIHVQLDMPCLIGRALFFRRHRPQGVNR